MHRIGLSFIKTIGTVLASFVAPLILSAVQHPTGGFATALQNDPTYALAWGVAGLLVHNYIEHSAQFSAQSNDEETK